MPFRKARIESSCSLAHELLSRSQAITLSAPALMFLPTPSRLPKSESENTQIRPAEISRTPIMQPAIASPLETPRPVAQPTRGSSWVLIRAATMSGTVAARAYQTAPPTSRSPAVPRSALALHVANALPAEARVRPSDAAGPAMRQRMTTDPVETPASEDRRTPGDRPVRAAIYSPGASASSFALTASSSSRFDLLTAG